MLSKHRSLNVTVVAKHMPGDYDIEYASPWAGANFMPVGKEGSKLRAFERASWPELDRLCREVPEAGIHYQECRVYGRKKDEGTAVGIWFQELMKEDPWFKDLMPEVGLCRPSHSITAKRMACQTLSLTVTLIVPHQYVRSPVDIKSNQNWTTHSKTNK